MWASISTNAPSAVTLRTRPMRRSPGPTPAGASCPSPAILARSAAASPGSTRARARQRSCTTIALPPTSSAARRAAAADLRSASARTRWMAAARMALGKAAHLSGWRSGALRASRYGLTQACTSGSNEESAIQEKRRHHVPLISPSCFSAISQSNIATGHASSEKTSRGMRAMASRTVLSCIAVIPSMFWATPTLGLSAAPGRHPRCCSHRSAASCCPASAEAISRYAAIAGQTCHSARRLCVAWPWPPHLTPSASAWMNRRSAAVGSRVSSSTR